MSLRSGSPWTSTSSPSCSWRSIVAADLLLQEVIVLRRVKLAVDPSAPRARGSPASGATSRSSSSAAAAAEPLAPAAARARPAGERRGAGRRRRPRPARAPPAASCTRASASRARARRRLAPAASRARPASAASAGLERPQLASFSSAKASQLAQLGIQPPLARGAVGDVQQRAGRRQPHAIGAEAVERRFDQVDDRLAGRCATRCGRRSPRATVARSRAERRERALELLGRAHEVEMELVRPAGAAPAPARPPSPPK